MMDLRFKGKRWLSQKPQKWLESVFNPIDGFINREKSECAANQVPAVGDSVKTDCPNGIQDPLPYYLEEPEKHETQVGSSENNSSLATSFRSMLSIGGKPVEIDVNRFSVEPEVDHLNKSHEEFSDVRCSDCTGEADDYLPSGMEIGALKDNKSSGVPDEIIIAKEEELIDKKTYIVLEENYMKEDLTHKYSDNLVEADDTNDKLLYKKFDIVEDYCAEESSWKEELDQCFSETKDLAGASLLSESTQAKTETSVEIPPQGLPCHPEKGRLSCSGELDMVDYVKDTLSVQSSDTEGISVEDKAVDVEVTSSSTSLFTEIYNILKRPVLDDSHPEDNICSSPRHALGCASETDLLTIPVENKKVDIGLASCNVAVLSTETSRVLELPHEDISNSDENMCSKPIKGIPGAPALPPSETDLSCIFVENKAVDMGLASSNASVSTEGYSTHDLSRCQENTCPKHVPAVRFASDPPYSASSSHASQTSSYDNNSADSTVSSSILSMLSNGGSCKVDIDDPGMETIELFERNEKAKLDGSCVVVDSELLHAASFRALRNRSYKKILQDAFASRKRLRKEYEQLAILYGDIDIEITNPQPAIDLLSSSAASSPIHSEKSIPGSSDPDWELL